MKNLFACFVLTFTFLNVQSQEITADKYAASITIDDLNDYLSILASDALEGRETGKRGQKMAAAFIEDHFRSIGLQSVTSKDGLSYLQKVPLKYSKPGNTFLVVNGEIKQNFKDVVYYGSHKTNGEENLNVVFGGDGSDKALETMDLSGKGVIIYNQGGFQAYSALRKKVQDKGAKAIFIVATDSLSQFNSMAGQFKSFIGNGSLQLDSESGSADNSIGVFFIPHELAILMLKAKSSAIEKAVAYYKGEGDGKKPRKMNGGEIKFNVEIVEEKIWSENVVGYIEGSEKSDELIIVTAHYDHIGKQGDQINNGADDDGSGTSAVMEMAEAFALAAKDGNGPKRSLLFMTVTGEEKGLLGSQFYVEHPIFGLKNTVANLNIDMIGRIDPSHENKPDYVYLVGSDKLSDELHELSETINKEKVQLDLDYTYNDENHPDRIYYRSDHWNFAKNNIPVIFYFNGTHDDYHRPTDTIEKINFEVLHKRTLLVFYTAWELANRSERIALK